MNKVDSRVLFYEQRRKDIISGHIKPIPFYGFPRLTKYIPGIIPGLMYKITSHMGMSKTQFTKYCFIYQPIFYCLKYGIKFQVLYFALEESEEEFIDGLFIHILKRKYNISVDRFSLTGLLTSPMTEDVLKAVKTAQQEVNLVMSYIKVVDNCYTPDAMFAKCKFFASKMGKFEIDSITKEEKYIPNDPDQVVLLITDHISLIESSFDTESNSFLSHSASIARWHTKMCRKIITKQWKWACLNVQQQSLMSEQQQFTSKGDSITAKILPTLDGLANNKEVARDDYIVLGIFSPDRYAIENFNGYKIRDDVNAFGDRFRSIHVIKNRIGIPNAILPLYFRGDYTYFKELPPITDTVKMQEFYNDLKK